MNGYELWSDWLSVDARNSLPMDHLFQADYCPEPHLPFFGGNTSSLHFLMTNPGKGLDVQKRDLVQAIDSTYEASVRRLADYYSTKLSGNASKRIKAMRQLSDRCKSQGYIQVETLPYHSFDLPNKHKLPDLIEMYASLKRYAENLTNYLADKNVIAISAISTVQEIAVSDDSLTPWLRFQGRIMGFNFDKAKKFDIVRHPDTGQTTGALLHCRLGLAQKAFYLMMGSNSLPGPKGIEKIARILTRR